MAIKNASFLLLFLALLSFFSFSSSDLTLPPSFYQGGYFQLLRPNIGVSAMHVQLLYTNKVVIFDRTDSGNSNLSLPAAFCPDAAAFNLNCSAHSLLYDFVFNSFRPLFLQTNTWCSSGALDAEGTLVQTGGYNDGERTVRRFTPCHDDKCDWYEVPRSLRHRRWYASNQILPDGRIIVVGGRSVFTYEFVPKKVGDLPSYHLRFLAVTRDLNEENNLYPFLHLLPDGNLFIFANTRSVLLDYVRNRVIKEFPVMPGDDKRNYPSTGSSVLLPLRMHGFNGTGFIEAEVLICGGSPPGAFFKADRQRVFVPASKTCGRLRVTDPDPVWIMEEMPMQRVMSDMVVLPTGDVLIINGAGNGTAGWENAENPVLNPVLYITYESDPNRKFVVQSPTKIPRMYHSTAVLLPDGRVLVGGSNPHVTYNFTAPYPTDLSLEAFHPPYLGPQFAVSQPTIIAVETAVNTVTYGSVFAVNFQLTACQPENTLYVGLMAPTFTTHSFAMNQRLVVLETVSVVQLSSFAYKMTVVGPTYASVAPPGYYMLFVVHAGIPSVAVWVKVGGFSLWKHTR